MMIKDVAEEIPACMHPPLSAARLRISMLIHRKGCSNVRFFFSEAVQGPSGGATPLLILKRRVKKIHSKKKILPVR